MKIDKPSDLDKENFRDLFEHRPELETMAMFGNLAAKVELNGQMCAGLFGASIGLRLSEEGRAELSAVEGAGPFGPEGRPMKEYVSVPASWVGVDADSGPLQDWIEQAIEHTSSLPPKKPKSKKSESRKSESKKSGSKRANEGA